VKGIKLLLMLQRAPALPELPDLPPYEPPPKRDGDELIEKLRFSIPCDRALLCLDCEVIFEAVGNQRCPSCGSKLSWMIGRALNRAAKEVPK